MSQPRTSDLASCSKRPAAMPLALALATAIMLSSLGCAFGEFRPDDPFDRQYTLDEAQHRYTTLVRFGDFDRAQDFVVVDDKDAFLLRMRDLDEARFTDYVSDPVELDEEKATATVKVTYTIYTPSVPYEVEVSETQVWSRGDGMSNNWRVRSTFEGLNQLASN